MRKTLLLLLLAGAAAPSVAWADPSDRGGDHGWSARSENSDSPRHSRSESSGRTERSQSDSNSHSDDGGNRPQPAVHVERSGGNDAPQVHSDGNGSGNPSPRHQSFGGLRQVQQDSSGGEAPAVVRNGGRDGGPTDTVRNWHGPKIVEPRDTSPASSLRQLDRPLPRVMQGRTPVISRTPREGTQPPLRTESRRSSNWTSWNHNWRNDRRYDWRNWRNRHRSHFHLGFYYDPFGWSYRPYSIGWRLWPSYYSSRYWISDPWEYRLPYAPPGYRWIRYWDDALLVDTFTGEVVDVLHNFFW
jgi:Ni/Co efflux regulator RcnB